MSNSLARGFAIWLGDRLIIKFVCRGVFDCLVMGKINVKGK